MAPGKFDVQLKFPRHEGYFFFALHSDRTPVRFEFTFSFGSQRENIETAKSGKHSRLNTRELFNRKRQALKPMSRTFGKNRLDAHSFKELLRARALKGKVFIF